MAVFKDQDYRRLLGAPDHSIPVILVYGPDHGLVSERFFELVAAYGSASRDDPFARIVLDSAEIDREPDRIVNEALTMSMFGGQRVIGVKAAGSKTIDAQIEGVLKQQAGASIVIVAAGDLKKTQTLRKRIETDKRAVAIPCYVDAGREVDRIIDEETAKAALTISREARGLLHTVLGADRLATRQEIRKLCLYCAGSAGIEAADVALIVTDAAALALDDLVDAVADGDLARVEIEFDRLTASGLNPAIVATQTMRHFHALDIALAARRSGQSADQALGALRPPIFYKRRDRMKRQLGFWDGARTAKAANVLFDAIEKSRKSGKLDHAIVSDALLSVARVANALAHRR